MYGGGVSPHRRPREALVGEAVAGEAIRRMFRRQAAHPIDDAGFVPLLRCVIEAAYRAAVTSGMNEEDATWMRDSSMQRAEEAWVDRFQDLHPGEGEDQARRRFRDLIKG